MNRYIPKKIQALNEYKVFKDESLLVLDANESPFLPDKMILEEFAEAARCLDYNRYPDSTAVKLVQAFSQAMNVPAACVAAGNGSDELISLIISSFLEPGDKVVVATPDFSMYKFYAELHGAQVEVYNKTEDFKIDFDDLITICKKTEVRLLIFSNPCNPTGMLYQKADVERLVKELPILVTVDEAYMEFADDTQQMMTDVEKYDNLIVLKTLSKAYGLASLRLGFSVANPELTRALLKVKSVYNVNGLSQELGRIMLGHTNLIKENVRRLREQRKILFFELLGLCRDHTFKVFDTHTNFVLIDAGESAKKILDSLLAKRIKIRMLEGKYLRITAGTEEENTRFIEEFRNILKTL